MKSKIIFAITCLVLISNQLNGQACLPDYQYRVPITINNPNASGFSSFQVRVVVNTQSLVAAGKARVDGGDFRFTSAAGLQLPYWFDAATFNTLATEFWIKVDNVPVGNSTIYMFYGNQSAPYVSSGDATFELFDDFLGSSLNLSKWTRCGSISNMTITGGFISLSANDANAATRDGILYSNQSFGTEVRVEADVASITMGRGVLGFVTTNKEGYAMTMENTSGVNVMKMSQVSDGTLGVCQDLSDVLIPAAATAGSLDGIWSFRWPAPGNQIISWPGGGPVNYNQVGYSGVHGNPKRVMMGTHIHSSGTPGTITIDWMRVRKLANVDPTTTIGAEEQYPVNPNPTSTGPYCEGENIIFNANFYPGVNYNWINPASVSFSALQNPTITSSTIANSGTYTLQVSIPGCPPVSQSVEVEVFPGSVAGTTSGSATVCSNSNSGTVSVSGFTGAILRWEMANSAGGPWYTISSTSSSITYSNLIQTTHFRPVIRSGACPEILGTAAIITVNNPTISGFVIGGTSVCSGSNSGSLSLVYSQGGVLQWQQSIDNGATWTNIVNNSTNYNYANLTTTTLFRAEVQNGVCPADFSASTQVIVNPLPVPGFTVNPVCQGSSSVFVNGTTISSGSISQYQWNFGNGSSSISFNPIYQYPAPGVYNAEVTAVSSAGCVASASGLVTVNARPIVNFNAAPVCLGSPTNFQAIVTVPGGSVASYDWDHGDGSTSVLPIHPHTYAGAGMYSALLVATSNQGCIDSLRKFVEVSAPVNVSFIADSVCIGQAISFVNTSTTVYPSVAYSWNFGNGATSSVTNPVYTYPAPGVYTVSLQATASGGATCSSVAQETVVIYDMPVPDFSYFNVCLSNPAEFVNQTTYSGNPTDLTFEWNLGDASTANTYDVTHNYSSQGAYNVTLTAITGAGCNASITQQIQIYSMPTANFTFQNVCRHLQTPFTNTSIITPGTLTYEWDFDDGNQSTLADPLNLYLSDGAYDVQLIATTNHGCKDTMVKTVTVYPRPVSDFINSPVCDGQLSTFTQSAIINSGVINSYVWDFGDGSSASSPVTSHQYLNPGTYQVKLTTVSDMGCNHDTTKAVIVHPVPVPDFTIQDACIGAPNVFTNQSIILTGVMTYTWDFGDGNSSIAGSPAHIYGSVGLYPVKLLAVSGFGCADSIVKFAEVYALPAVNAGLDVTVSKGDATQLNGAMATGSTYSWTPVDYLSDPYIANPVARPEDSTLYTLTVVDMNGCQNSDAVWVFVKDDFKLLIHNILTPDGNGKNDTWLVQNIDYYPEALVQIFNRWGEKVYETLAYQNDWNGTNGLDQLPDGTYYYIITFPDTDFHYKGGITLLRNR